jgi:hypothetical protein
MNVLIKRLAICGVLYAVAETSFMIGKGYSLGLLKGYGVSASYATELLNGDDANWKGKFISKISDLEEIYIKAENES